MVPTGERGNQPVIFVPMRERGNERDERSGGTRGAQGQGNERDTGTWKQGAWA